MTKRDCVVWISVKTVGTHGCRADALRALVGMEMGDPGLGIRKS